jgi:hypothetical protein
MGDFELTADYLIVLAGIFQSLIFEYVPGVAPWYAGKTDVQKRGIQALLLLAIAVAIGIGGCLELYSSVACNDNGFAALFGLWFTALVANQTTYSIARKPRKQ